MAKVPVTIEQQPIDDGLAVRIGGEVNYGNSREMRGLLQEAMASRPRRLIIDLQDVPYMDSSGVATLVEVLQAQKAQGGKLVLCQMQPKVLAIFEIARLTAVFEIVDSVETAREA